jgi:DNA (cytosine-5)-methyltransferase 1
MIGLEVFSGAGGMSVGAHLAGIDIKLAIEIDPHAAYTYSLNHRSTAVLNTDIRKIKSIDIECEKNSTILFGGPPCQGFSLSNQRTRNIGNENNWLFEEYMRIAGLWKPDWIVLENVSGLLLTERGFFLDKILQKLKKLGYRTSYKLLDASNYGVPQKRERLFIVGNLHGIDFIFPKSKKKKITVKEALADLPKLENGSLEFELPYKSNKIASSYATQMRCGLKTTRNHYVTRNSELVVNRYQHIPQGGNWTSIPERLLKNYADFTRCHGGIYHRLMENEPSVVIGNYRKNMLIHPRQDRGLSVREAARLQSFPDWFEFYGFLTHQQQQVGNAVPPLLAKAVFDKIISHL